MAKVAQRKCGDCGELIGPTERHWTHVTRGGLMVESFCEECMLGQVNDYAERTIMGMLSGSIPTVIKARVVGRPSEVNPE